jgi:hypothetical protein
MRFMHFLDGVSQLQATPIFHAMNVAILGCDLGFVTLDHGGHLLALIGMNEENDLVMTH